MTPLKHLLVVDGYNVLNHWGMADTRLNLEAARDDLIELLADYAGYEGIRVLVVFDAHLGRSDGSEEERGDVAVIYTKRSETADSRIERLIKSLVKIHDRVTVVTADYTLQLFIMTEGALRMTPGELKMRIESVRGRGVAER